MKTEKPRIAMLSVHSSPLGQLGTNDTGGMSVCIREIARKLGEGGYFVDIFTRQSDLRQRQTLYLYDNVRLIHLKVGNKGYMSKLAIYPLLQDLFNEIERFRTREGIHYNFVHSHYWLSGKVGEIAQKQWNSKHFITFHTLGAVKNHTEGVEKEPELRIMTEKRLARTCSRIIASTQSEKKHLMHYYDALPGSIGIVPCGVNLDLFHPLDKWESRKRLGFYNNDSLLLCVSRFVPSKGVDRLLEAMSYLRNNRKMRLLIAGGDDQHTLEAQNLRKLSRQLGVQDQVTFLGRIEQEKLPAYYSAADILVVPSRYESFGLIALESMACGTPVVATRVGAMEKILKEGETGHLVINGSPHYIAEGIDTFISNSNVLSADAIRTSVRGFGWADVTSALITEYESSLCQ